MQETDTHTGGGAGWRGEERKSGRERKREGMQPENEKGVGVDGWREWGEPRPSMGTWEAGRCRRGRGRLVEGADTQTYARTEIKSGRKRRRVPDTDRQR